jgi:hypothetical protein
MDIVAVFPYSVNVELVLTELLRFGIARENLAAVPLRNEEKPLTIEAVGTGGRTPFDIAFLIGTIGMMLGCIYGFVLPGGPIFWALGLLIVGFSVGFAVEFMIRNRQKKRDPARYPGIVLMIHCRAEQEQAVKQILQRHLAKGIGII